MSSQTTAADPTARAPDIPAQAWRWPIGVGLADVGHSRVTRPMIDDGPWGGVPVGGLGSGSIGRTQGGEFARWHLGIGRHRFGPVAGCAFSVFTAPADDLGEGEAHVLSTLRPDALPGWRRDLPEGAGTYHALFPRAWLVYDWDALPVRLTQAQLSPVLPGDYRASSYPVGVFEWTVENPTDRPMRVGLMLTWQALDEDGVGTPTGSVGRLRRIGELAGVSLDVPGDATRTAGQYAIVATAADAGRVTARSRFDALADTELWADFAADGALDDLEDPTPSREGEAIGGAVAVTLEVPAGGRSSARFALAWDFPVMRFGWGTEWYRRYTRFFGRDGGHAWDIAAEGLACHRAWEAAIERWQRPLLDDPARPDWYVMALLNELYVLVDGGSAWEDGRVGEPSPVDGEGRFAFLECFDYPFYDTHDVLFYASWATLQLWPDLERRMLRSLIGSIPVDDPEPRITEATGEPQVRKVAGMAPHDVGGPLEDPWLRLNAYTFQDPNRWKDLNSKFVLQVVRDARWLDDPTLLREAWPAIRMALARLAATDLDGDGLPDHDGRADQTFDTWPMRGPSAYAGGLWLAALSAAEAVGTELGDPTEAGRFGDLWEQGSASYRRRLWNGRYLLYDGSGGPHSDSIMADQLCGSWECLAAGLPPYLDTEDVRTALRTIVDTNVRRFGDGCMGAVNGMRPDGTVDTSSEQSAEVWPGVTYTLAALLLASGLEADAWETARGAVRMTWERGLWFRTPEAWDARGDFRATMYMRPLAIWAIEAVLTQTGRAGGPERDPRPSQSP